MNLTQATSSACLILLASVPCGFGELSAADKPGHFAESASVVVVELPVRVLLDGQPVPDLGPEDFEIYDRGRRQVVTGFEVMDHRPLLPEQSAGQPLGRPPAPRRNWLLLFDLAYADGMSLSKALAASRKQVQRELQAGDTVSVAFFSALRGLKLIAPPAAQRDAAARALDLMESVLVRDRVRLEAFLQDRPPTPLDLEGQVASDEELRSEAGILNRADAYWPHRSVIRSFARALGALATSLANLPGQRTLVLFSHGFDPLYLTGRGSVGTLQELERAFRACRGAGWVIQAINAGGLRAPVGRDTLFYLAHETGGESYENFNDLDQALHRMNHRGSLTYLLSFDANDIEPDGSFHRLRVRVKGLPLRAEVVHRPGYYAPTKDDRTAE